MITVWRIGYCADPQIEPAKILAGLGFGSRQGNGRWHQQGPVEVVYAGSTRALCQLEKRVHCNGFTPKHQALMRLDLPSDATLLEVTEIGLPEHWKSDEGITQQIGMDWLSSGSSLGLWVPSYIEPQEKNLLLNPQHSQFTKIQLTLERHPFKFDPRMFG